MGTRVIIQGRRYRVGFHGDQMPDEERKPEAPKDFHGRPVDTWPIAPSKKIVEFRAGVPYTCPEDGITYRVLRECRPADGWAPAQFWRKRWKVRYSTICLFCEKGWLQPGIEEGSPTKRFRCIDEVLVVEYLNKLRKRRGRPPRYPD